LVALGVVQLFVVFTIDLRRFIASGHNPDVISGTFGTNAYQLVFFLLVVTALLATMLTCEPKRLASRFAPLFFFFILVAIFLAQYRALLVTTAVTVLVIGVLLRRRARGVIAAVLIIASLVVTLQYVSAHFPQLKFASTVSTLLRNPGFYVSERLDTFRIAGQLYADSPAYIFTGTGPGTFSSRAWQTFAQAQSKSGSNVQGQYALRLTSDSAYHTDVSDKYVLPRVQSGAVIQGSGSLSSPFSSYLSLMAETGLLGFFLMAGLYIAATARALSLARHSLRGPAPGDPLPGLLVAAAVAFTVLLQMGLLAGNWLEVTRLTFLSWSLLAIAMKEVEARSAGTP
jgi:O-antigen ligase